MNEVERGVSALLTDPDFLALEAGHERPNLFEILAATTAERWHSAFVKWLIDPSSHLGLGDFPLKRLLTLICSQAAEIYGEDKPSSRFNPALSLGDIEQYDFAEVAVDVEYGDEALRGPKGGKAKIDVFARAEAVRAKDGSHSMPFALVIENKVKAREHDDQTQTYRDWAATRTAAEKCFLVYLRPSDADEPVCKDFIPITYQQLFDEVIRHCLGHPSLGLESKYLLEQYRQNLAATPKRGYQMAQPNRDVCLKIYKAHQKALDEIFLAVKGEAPVPAGKTGERRITTYNVTLDQLVSQGLLSLDDRLLANYRQRGYEAGLVRTPEGVRIEFEGTTYPLPTTPARKITASNLNGWRFWRVVGPDGEEKGLLDDIRARLMHGHDDEVEDDSAP